MQTDDLLNEREGTHGLFAETSAFAQALKGALRGAVQWDALSAAQREALDMISNKMARICNGNPDHRDHWLDVAGYAILAARTLPIGERDD